MTQESRGHLTPDIGVTGARLGRIDTTNTSRGIASAGAMKTVCATTQWPLLHDTGVVTRTSRLYLFVTNEWSISVFYGRGKCGFGNARYWQPWYWLNLATVVLNRPGNTGTD